MYKRKATVEGLTILVDKKSRLGTELKKALSKKGVYYISVDIESNSEIEALMKSELEQQRSANIVFLNIGGVQAANHDRERTRECTKKTIDLIKELQKRITIDRLILISSILAYCKRGKSAYYWVEKISAEREIRTAMKHEKVTVFYPGRLISSNLERISLGKILSTTRKTLANTIVETLNTSQNDTKREIVGNDARLLLLLNKLSGIRKRFQHMLGLLN